MLSNEDLTLKNSLEKMIVNCKSIMEILDIIRGNCDKISINNNIIEVEVDKTTYYISVVKNKVIKIKYWEQNLLQYKEINF